MIIILDNGHGQDTPGKRSPLWDDGTPQLFEWSYTRAIVQNVASEFKRRSIETKILVPEIIDISLKERCRRANDIVRRYPNKHCLLVSVHINASNGQQAMGWEIHTSKGETTSDKYALIFWKTARELLPKNIKMRGDNSDGNPDWDSNFAILRDTTCPAVLTENLFMDNIDDCRFLLSKTGKKTITDIHVLAILRIIKTLL